MRTEFVSIRILVCLPTTHAVVLHFFVLFRFSILWIFCQICLNVTLLHMSPNSNNNNSTLNNGHYEYMQRCTYAEV